jgi:hypothetical protein
MNNDVNEWTYLWSRVDLRKYLTTVVSYFEVEYETSFEENILKPMYDFMKSDDIHLLELNSANN